ncbi:claudin-15-like isoform X1 [Ornithorhynchus anatinus]|uniref:Claudin n=1 Tax=Ornithorhynchus anatinus TaxID=9258 RepID=A0A6I8NI46_ORNAN|nr:claudin-15-like isoform X1 [Ornithorhynchus anatinus]
MSAVLEIMGFLLSLGGWLVLGSTLPNGYWKVSTLHGSVITTSTLYENLWKSCAEDSTGISNCKKFDSMLALPDYIQACRALMIASLVLGFLATMLSMFGLQCTNVGSTDEKTKGKIAVTGGSLFILSGVLALVTLSWYAARITAQFFDPLDGGTKYELGSALYIGWFGCLLDILGGAFLTCSCKQNKQVSYSNHRYDYSAAPTTGRIYKNPESLSSKVYV